MIRKTSFAVLAAMTAIAVSAPAFADDITVKAPAGEEKVTLTEGAEVDIHAEELSELVKNALVNISDFDVLLDAGVDIGITAGETEIPIKGGIIGNLSRSGDYAHMYMDLNFDMMGTANNSVNEMYAWSDETGNFTATKAEDGSWQIETSTSTVSDSIGEALAQIKDYDTSKILGGLTPEDHLYEANGKEYYVCSADLQTVLSAAQDVEAAADMSDMAAGILGDNNPKITMAIEKETGLPYFVAIAIEDLEGEMPGEMLGAEGSMKYVCNDLHASVFFDTEVAEILIPEEVANAASTESGSDEIIDDSNLAYPEESYDVGSETIVDDSMIDDSGVFQAQEAIYEDDVEDIIVG